MLGKGFAGRGVYYRPIAPRVSTDYSNQEPRLQFELDAMSDSSRKHFELSVEQDQHECTSDGRSLCTAFNIQEGMNGKLRRLIGWPKNAQADQLEVAKGFVSACEEMTASDSIKAMGTICMASTLCSMKPYFPHIRFYDFCRRLLDLNPSKEKIEDSLARAKMFKYFGRKLDKAGKQSRIQGGVEHIVVASQSDRSLSRPCELPCGI
jgi:hypothetical protein